MPSRLAARPKLSSSAHRVTLTPAGEVLLDDARTALDAVSAAARRAQHAAETTSKLRLALKADIDGGLLPRISTSTPATRRRCRSNSCSAA